jgi:hypothetical protein
MGDLLEVWFKLVKNRQDCVIGDELLQMVLESLPSLRWGSMHKPITVANGHSLRHQEHGDPMRVASKNVGSQEEVIVTSHIAWV